MRRMGLRGAPRGRAFTITTRADETPERPAALVQRACPATRPDPRWGADRTSVATWRGFGYVAVVIDVFSRRIVGWRVDTTWRSARALDTLEQAVCARPDRDGLIHHSDRGVHYLSIRSTDRLADAGIEPALGTVGASSDQAAAESVIGLYKTDVIRRQGPWRHVETVELATLAWGARCNTQRVLEPIGYVPPSEYEDASYRNPKTVATPGMGAGVM